MTFGVKHKKVVASDMKLATTLVGVRGFEPRASWSRTKRATICATPRDRKPSAFRQLLYYNDSRGPCQEQIITGRDVFAKAAPRAAQAVREKRGRKAKTAVKKMSSQLLHKVFEEYLCTATKMTAVPDRRIDILNEKKYIL